ncbi:hypothetical protein [Flammeovirga sp. EKP202]|uniref:hypothetical protein n=1 Tax=Flammeovirga sp. EKP202 TaxID=2770592 RepID=UPI00165F71CD|nr:hypothetical protein [Flammeovirga sp. EKP202]MBD0403175.1 hypothetical protein [Flammeovirga sp. EKP202]
MLKTQTILYLLIGLLFSCNRELDVFHENKQSESYKVKIYRNWELSPNSSLNTYSDFNLKITTSFLDKSIKTFDYGGFYFVYDDYQNKLKGNWLEEEEKEWNFVDKKTFTINHQQISVSKFVELRHKKFSCTASNYDTISTLYFSNELGLIHDLGWRYQMNFEVTENSILEGIDDVKLLFEKLNKDEDFYPNVHKTALRKAFKEIIIPQEEEIDIELLEP